METINVIIESPTDYKGYNLQAITIAAHCPICGERRGKPTLNSYYTDGFWYSVHNWHNPCGHQDSYQQAWEQRIKA